MNAKELHRLIVAGRIALVDPTTSHPHLTQEIVHRALSLLAAAEANDGTTPETDDPNNIDTWRATKDRSRRLERERNGLALAHADALETITKLQREISLAWNAIGGRDKHWIEHSDEDGVLKRSGLTLHGALIFVTEQLAEKEREFAKLKEHAEAMAVAIEHSQGYVNAANAYRRHFPKDEK